MRKAASLLLLSLGFLVACGQEPAEEGSANSSGTDSTDPSAASPQDPSGSDLGTQQPAEAGGSALVPEGQFDPATGTRVHLRVVTEADGQPLSECPVALYWERGGEAVGRIVTMTDEEGKASFEIFQRTFVQKLVALGTGATAPEASAFAAFVGAEETELIEIAVKPAARFAGRVVDLDGNPVPGAKLQAWSEDRWQVEGMAEVEPTSTGTAGADGAFRMGGMPGGPFLLTAVADGMLAVQRAVGLNDYDEEIGGIEIVLSRANLVDGQVLDENGDPVQGALIEAGVPRRRVEHTPTPDERLVYIPARQWMVESDSDGGFQLPAVPASQAWNIRIRHGSFRDFRDRFEAGSRVLQYKLERGLEVYLSVLDTDSKPIPDGDAVLLGKSARQAPLRLGGAALLGLEDDPDAIVMVRASGYAMKAVWPIRYNTQDAPLELVLEPAQPIIGQVVDREGNPIPDVVLTARGLDFLEAFPADLRATFPGKQPEEIFQLNRKASGEDGRFRFGQLYGGRWEITAETPDGRTMTEVVEAPRSDLRLIF